MKDLLSGLTYDININNINIIRYKYKTIQFNSNEVHPRNLWTGHNKHSISEMPYIFNTQWSHYIDIKTI